MIISLELLKIVDSCYDFLSDGQALVVHNLCTYLYKINIFSIPGNLLILVVGWF